MNIEGLKELYQSDETAKALFDHMGARKRNQSETRLERILTLLREENPSIKKSALIAVFRRLEEMNCGRYVEGRHGYWSRFAWGVESLRASKAAQGVSAQVESIEPEASDEEYEYDTLDHTFNLRADYQVELPLPVDLSSSEADRLTKFITSLPFEEYQE